MNRNNSLNTDDLDVKIKTWWQRQGMMCKCVIIMSCSIYLLGLVYTEVLRMLVNLPLFTIYHLQIYRLCTTWLVHFNLLSLLFSLLSAVPLVSQIEQQKGSTYLLIHWLGTNFILQLIYTSVMWLVSQMYPIALLMPSAGCWPLVMVYLTTRCLQSPEQQTYLLCFPILLRNKYYPLVLGAIFLLLQPQLDILLGLFYAYFLHYYCQSFSISNAYIQRIEKVCCSCLINRNDFISLSNTSSVLPVNNPQPHYNQQIQTKSISNFTGKGVSIGGNPINQSRNNNHHQYQPQVDTTLDLNNNKNEDQVLIEQNKKQEQQKELFY